MAGVLDTFGFADSFNVGGIAAAIGGIFIVFFIAIILGGLFYFAYRWKKGKDTHYNKEIGWWEEVNDNLVPLFVDKAQEITIPGTNLRVFYIKNKDLWLPRFTRGITKDLFYVAVTADREIINFSLKSLAKDRAEAGLNYDHTDMRWAAENTREFIKRNYRDKATPWWKEYKEVIATVALLLVITFSFVIIIFFMRGIVEDIGVVSATSNSAIEKLKLCAQPVTSGIATAGA